MFSAILIISLIPYDSDAALSCKRIPLEEKYEKIDLIFAGKAIQKENATSFLEEAITTFEIEKVYKGNTLTEVRVGSVEDTFGIEFKVGEKYLVFAEPKDNYFFVSGCTMSAHLVSENTMKIIDQVILLQPLRPLLPADA